MMLSDKYDKFIASMKDKPGCSATKISTGYSMTLTRNGHTVHGKGVGFICLYQDLLKKLEAKENAS